MAKTETLRTRMEPSLKIQGEAVLTTIGLSTTEAITMFFRQVVMQQGLPFEAKIPNTKTLEAFKEATETPEKLTRYPNAKIALDNQELNQNQIIVQVKRDIANALGDYENRLSVFEINSKM